MLLSHGGSLLGLLLSQRIMNEFHSRALTLPFYKFLHLQIVIITQCELQLISIIAFMIRANEQNGREVRGEIFQALDKVDLKSKEVGEYSIIICGITRTGKSTIHNLIMNPQMIVGKGKNLKTQYVLRVNNDPKAANIGDSFTSVTMIPNVSQIPYSQITIVDLPGLGERGKGIEVIKVNYINAKFFQAAKKAKFILVFTEGSLRDIDNGGFKDTLHNFLSFFNFDQFTSVEKRQLFSSIAFCFTSVDFRGNTREKVKVMYQQALEDALYKLEEWHRDKPSEMPTFPIAKELIQTILKQRRIQLFQIAVDGKSPTGYRILQNLDNCQWKFLNLQDKIDKITFHYDKQYQSLDQPERKFVDENIKWRFSFCQNIKTAIDQMLTKITNSFGQKIINIDEEIVTVNNILKDLPKYGMPAQQLQIPVVCTPDQRLIYFQQLDETVKRVDSLKTWKEANKKSPLSEYYTRHLAGIFTDQLIIIRRLFSYSPGALQMLKNLYVNINKMLAQASIFASLSPDFQSIFKQRLSTQIIFGNQIGSIDQVKQKFIGYFHNLPLQIKDWRIEEVERIIKVFSEMKSQSKEMNPTICYGILCRLKHMMAHKYRTNNKFIQFVEQSYSALVEALKSHICFSLVPLSSSEAELQHIINLQRSILTQTGKVFNPERNKDQFDRTMQLKSLFNGLENTKSQAQFKSIIRNIFKSLAGINEKEIDEIISQYRTVMKSEIAEEKVKIETPSTYSFCSQVQFYAKIKQVIKGKKVIFVLGESLCGKSVVIQVLKRRKMTFNKNGSIDLERQSKFNKINHTNIPSQFPNLTPLNEDELFVEIPSYHKLPPQEKYIKMGLLLDLMMSTDQFRIILVAKEATLSPSKESKERSFENMFSQIVNMLLNTPKKQPESEPSDNKKRAKQSKQRIITLVVTSDKITCRKLLEGIVNSLNLVDEKVGKYLTRMIEKNHYICETIQNATLIARDFQNLKASYFNSSQLTITYGDLYTKLLSVSEKNLFIEGIAEKTNLIKQIINPLQVLASAALNLFVERSKISQNHWSYKQITACLDNPIASRFELDLSSLPHFQTTVASMDNRPQIYHKLVELRLLAQDGIGNGLNVAYQKYGNYLDYFFKTMVHLCCNNRHQYLTFMKINTVLINLSKELKFVSLIFAQGQDHQLENLKEKMWPREISDATTNFPDIKSQELVKCLLRQATSWKFDDVRSNIKFLGYYIKRYVTPTSVATAARIELLVFMQRLKKKNFDIDWDEELTEQGLIETIFDYPFIQLNSSSHLQGSLKKAKKTFDENENALSELYGLKMKLLA